jgi:hypothetical protein
MPLLTPLAIPHPMPEFTPDLIEAFMPPEMPLFMLLPMAPDTAHDIDPLA